VLKNRTDDELMLAYQLGDEAAFTVLYTRHSAKVYGYIKSKLRSEEISRDVFQATFLKLHRSRRLYNPALPFTPWLFTICRNELLDSLKKTRRSREDLTGDLENFAATETPTSDLSGLGAREREALTLRYLNGSSFEEIAAALKTSPVNARQVISRAIKTLRGLYEKK
jgi:RNA polymerase sigma factor (sigma-70 family)